MTAFVNGTARSSRARADELDRLVRGRVRSDVEVAELVRAEAERCEHRRVELAHGPAAERLDRVVERPHALHGSVRELLRERALARVEVRRRGAQRAVRVRLLLEHAPHDLERSAARRRDAHRFRVAPRKQPFTAVPPARQLVAATVTGMSRLIRGSSQSPSLTGNGGSRTDMSGWLPP